MGGSTDFTGILNFTVKGLGSVLGARAELEKLAHAGANVEKAFRSQAWATAFSAYSLQSLGGIFAKLTADATKLQDVVTRASASYGGNQAMMAEHIKNVALTMKGVEHGPIAIAEAILAMQKQGLRGAESMGQLQTVLDVATVTMSSTKEAAESVATAFKGWKGPFDTVSTVMETFSRGSKLAGMSLKDFMKTMQQAQGPALAYGMSLRDAAVATALIAPVAGGRRAGAALAASLKLMGSEKGQQFIGKPSGDFLTDMGRLADKVNASPNRNMLLQKYLGRRGMIGEAGMERGLIEGTVIDGQFYRGTAAIQAMRNFVGSGKKEGGLAAQAEIIRQQSPAARFEAIKSQFSKTMTTFGEQMLPLLEKLTPAIMAVAKAFSFLFSGTTGQLLVWGGALLAAVGALKLLRGTLMVFGAGGIMSRLGLVQAGNVHLTGALSAAGRSVVSGAPSAAYAAGGGFGNLGAGIAMAAQYGGVSPLAGAFRPLGPMQSTLAAMRYGPGWQGVVAQRQAELLMHLAHGGPAPVSPGFLGGIRESVSSWSSSLGGSGRAWGESVWRNRAQEALRRQMAPAMLSQGLLVGPRRMLLPAGIANAMPAIGGALGSAAGATAGFVGSLVASLGPMALFAGAIVGITSLLEHYQKLEEQRQAASAEVTSTVLGSRAVGIGFRHLLSSGTGAETPEEVRRILLENPNAHEYYGSLLFSAAGMAKGGVAPHAALAAAWGGGIAQRYNQLEKFDKFGMTSKDYNSTRDALRGEYSEWLKFGIEASNRGPGALTKEGLSGLVGFKGRLFSNEKEGPGQFLAGGLDADPKRRAKELLTMLENVGSGPLGMRKEDYSKLQYEFGQIGLSKLTDGTITLGATMLEISRRLRTDFNLGDPAPVDGPTDRGPPSESRWY